MLFFTYIAIFLLVRFYKASSSYHATRLIPRGTNCAPHVADFVFILFLL